MTPQERLAASEKIGNRTILQLTKIYDRSARTIDTEILRLYETFAGKVGLDVSELKKLINGSDRANLLLSLNRSMSKMGLRVQDVYPARYLARLTRLEALKTQIFWEVQALAKQEVDLSAQTYRDVYASGYQNSAFDITGTFGRVDTRGLQAVLDTPWEGATYSARVWANTNALAKELPELIGTNMVTGSSYEKTVRVLRDRFEVGKYEATRLVRTELNYVHNQAELQSYTDLDIEEYEYLAELDDRTSVTCEKLHGLVFKVKDARVGENYPPMHPNCRSTTKAVIPARD